MPGEPQSGKIPGGTKSGRARGCGTKFAGERLRLSASDVANFVACQHRTRLDLLAARGALRRVREFDLGFQDLVRRGEAHELTVLERFRADGRSITEINQRPDADAARATREAIGSGTDVIYQGVLLGASPDAGTALLGRPDFLVRAGLLAAPDEEPRPGELHYEVVDAKLARTAKARAVAQTAFYSHLLAALQGVRPRWMHLALGGGGLTSLKVGDYAAYERQARRALGTFIAVGPGHNPPTDPYPEPVEHCVICRWDDLCKDRRRRDDDLSLVAGITKGQRRTLKTAGVPTRRALASLDVLPGGNGVSRQSLEGARLQARLQVASEDEGRIRYEVLDPERDAAGALLINRGLLALPEPASGDLFFDIEGARYYSEDGKEFGLQYLFGVVDTADTDARGRSRYTQIWAFDRPGEKRAFEELVDFITERRRHHPGPHVYHYNHYEPTSVDHLTELHGTRQEAVGRLMGRFATREDEVDDLFRRGVFVDLYRVVRQGVRAGVESYAIKRLEPLVGCTRQMDLRQATENLISFDTALEDQTAKDGEETKRVVAAYNEDDCRATLALRDWLEQRRADLAGRLGEDLPRPAAAEEPKSTEDPATGLEPGALESGLRDGDLDIAAGTAWVWARDQFQGTVDTLFVDEAGQMSLGNILTVADAARNLVLIGDPQQLAQPSQAAHPPGAGVSALEHVLGDQATVPPDAGLLLDQTWRMHPRLCRFTLETFYDGKLSYAKGLERQTILGDATLRGSGLRVVEVTHEGNTNASPEEAAEVARLVRGLVGRQWQDKDGARRVIGADEVLVVMPYNAQIRAIEEALARAGCSAGVRVGTVDKFQGRAAPVAIYSMATSSADDAPRGLEFLYDPHRLNVATSRARAMAVVVASADLIRVACRTPRQMYLANALCRAWESTVLLVGTRCAALTETAAGQLPARRRPARSSRRPWCATRRPARLSRR